MDRMHDGEKAWGCRSSTSYGEPSDPSAEVRLGDFER